MGPVCGGIHGGHFCGETFAGPLAGFAADDVDREVASQGLGVDPSTLESAWQTQVADVLSRATLTIPKVGYMQRGGRDGKHTEHLGHMLSEMQIVARSHPGASW